MKSKARTAATLPVLAMALLLLCTLVWWLVGGGRTEGVRPEPGVEAELDRLDDAPVVREPVGGSESPDDVPPKPTVVSDSSRSEGPTVGEVSTRVAQPYEVEEDPTPPPNPHPPWLFEKTIAPAGLEHDDYFPSSLDLDGDRLVAGAAHREKPGRVLVFCREDEKWWEEARLSAGEDAGRDLFGTAVSLSGDTLVVGAPSARLEIASSVDDAEQTEERTTKRLGAAYVFTRKGTEWTRVATLTSDSEDDREKFGGAVCIAGDTTLVGAGHEWSDSWSGRRVHVFVREGTEWKKQAELQAGDDSAADWQFWFGESVSLAEDRAVVGAKCHEGTSLAYVFERRDDAWYELCRLGASGPWSRHGRGWSVAMYGDDIAVTVEHIDIEPRVLLYQIDGEACRNTDLLLPSPELSWPYLELTGVAMHDDTLVVSWADWHGARTGKVDVYDRANFVWRRQAGLVPPGDTGWSFGRAIAVSKSWIAVGSGLYFRRPSGESGGGVHLFRREETKLPR